MKPFDLKAATLEGSDVVALLLIAAMIAGGDWNPTFPMSLPGESFSTCEDDATSTHCPDQMSKY